MPNKKEALKDALLEAQLQFYLNDLTGNALKQLVKAEAEYAFDVLTEVTLSKAVSKKKVAKTAHRYAIDMEIGGAIPELFGEIAQVIYTFEQSETTPIGDLVSDEIAEAFINKVFEQNSVLDHTVNNVRSSKAFRDFITDLVVTVMKGYLAEQSGWLKSGTVSKGTKVLRNWIGNVAPELEDTVENQIRKITESAVENSLEMFDEVMESQQYRDTAHNTTLALWDQVKTWPVSRFRTYVSEEDLQDFMVLGYEFWHEFRHTEYLENCIQTGVDFVFKKYGRKPIGELLTDFGIEREMVIGEILNYAPDLAKLIESTGLAEAFLRRHLTRFYESTEAKAILG